MLYKSGKGRIKDNCMIYHDGTYFMFSMYWKSPEDTERHVWLATSKDGVHFEDYGCVVEDFPTMVWAMKVYETDDGFYMNHGSFTEAGEQKVLKFWHSDDLYHWEYRPDLEIISPDADWGITRLDCMCVLREPERYYGYATGQYGFMTSDDGAHWDLQPYNIDYGPFQPYSPCIGGYEIGDCIRFEGKYYLLCGAHAHAGCKGYGVWTYVADKPEGPFKPMFPNYKLNGTSDRWVHCWVRCFDKDGKTLMHNYMYDGNTFEMGTTYLPPIKEMALNEYGLYLKWWDENRLLYGNLVSETARLEAKGMDSNALLQESQACDISELVSLPAQAVVDMTVELEESTWVGYAAGGLYLAEDDHSGTAIIFDAYGKSDILYVKDGQIVAVEDTVTFGQAAPILFSGGTPYHIRLLVRDGMFEVYVNDTFLQTFNNAHKEGDISCPFTAIGAVSRRRGFTLSDMKIYEMNL
ncbi:MAG: hypothetical protein IJ518_01195 [Clostridia bacterium]|nr:hypothetical protein [Clostridia bacterium]